MAAMAAEIEKLLEPTRNTINLSESQIRQVAVNQIVEEFLAVDEVNLDMRAYLVESVLPCI
jgi:hypothetical protein